METLNFLSYIKQLADIKEDQLSLLKNIIKKHNYKKNEFFVKRGEYQNKIGYVLKGLFRLYYIDYNGKEYIKSFSAENNFISAYAALLQNKPSHLYIEALEDSQILLIPYFDFLQIANQNICWQIILRKLTEIEYLAKEKRESDFLFYNAENRYLNFKKENPNFEQRLNIKYVASYLDMSPETLSRIRSNLK